MATVVILEDNPEIASLYVQIFDQHRTLIMSDVPDAIGYLKHERPDLVIMDFHLPSGSGVDVLNFMRSKAALKDVPVLGVSVDDLMKDEAHRQGMDAFLTKPIELTELINTAQRLMSSPKPNVPSAELRIALQAYGEAYKAVYNRPPKGQWTGTQALIDGQPCDEHWLHSETNRLRSLIVGGVSPRNYLMRLLDKVRRL
jgi:CheY-like chemotaxis protein